MNSLVSAVIPTIDGRETCLKNAVNSVINQTYQNIETIVIRNNLAPVSRNEGIKKSNGEFVALLDDDDTWEKTKTEKQHKVMMDNPDCPLVICWSRDLRFGKDRIVKPPETITRAMLLKSFNLSSTSTYFIRKAVLKNENPVFDPALHSGQEYDLAIRLSKYGDIKCVQEVLMIQNSTEGQISENWTKKIKGQFEFYRKYHREFGVFGHIKFLGLLTTFFGGFIFGNKIYSLITFMKERYESGLSH